MSEEAGGYTVEQTAVYTQAAADIPVKQESQAAHSSVAVDRQAAVDIPAQQESQAARKQAAADRQVAAVGHTQVETAAGLVVRNSVLPDRMMAEHTQVGQTPTQAGMSAVGLSDR